MSRNGTSAKNEVNEILQESGYIRINEENYTKHGNFDSLREQGITNYHELTGRTAITQSETYQKYKGIFIDYVKFCRSEGMGHNMKAYPASSVGDFISHKMQSGLSENTMQGICSAMNKLDDILNAVDGGKRDFSAEIDRLRPSIREECPHLDVNTRRFDNPQAVIDAIADPNAKIAASLQLETGLRLNDVCFIRLNDNGTLNISSKAGYRVPEFQIPARIYDQLKEIAGDRTSFRLIDNKHYAYEVKKACAITGEHYTGTHAFRHNFAINDYARCKEQGMTDKEAKSKVSQDLFHQRLEIVDTYIKR